MPSDPAVWNGTDPLFARDCGMQIVRDMDDVLELMACWDLDAPPRLTMAIEIRLRVAYIMARAHDESEDGEDIITTAPPVVLEAIDALQAVVDSVQPWWYEEGTEVVLSQEQRAEVVAMLQEGEATDAT